MPKIMVLSEQIAGLIAAGEVVERPLSVVKELVENSVDAGAGLISVAIAGGGIEFINVADNGCGISQEDVPLAFQRHATSKITSIDDLNNIGTLGFRGEALPSIAAVADVKIKTRLPGHHEGSYWHIRGGTVMESGSVGCPAGTNITVRDIFFNTPARLKHLKSKSTEGALIIDLLYKMALTRPGIKFVLTHNEREVLRSSGSGKMLDALVAVYGADAARKMIQVCTEESNIKIEGYISKPELSRSSKQQITIAVNGRLIRSGAINAALEEAYRGFLTVGRYPVAALMIQIQPEIVDVNVHPAKTKVKILIENQVKSLITSMVRKALRENNLIVTPGVAINHVIKKAPSSKEPFKLQFAGPESSHPVLRSKVDEDCKDIESNAVKMERPAVKTVIDHVSEAAVPKQVSETASGYSPGAFPVMDVVGQLLNLYIVTCGKDGIYIIDQHAAHERVLFEQYARLLNSGNAEVQYLLAPANINLKMHQSAIIKEYENNFRDVGFVFEDFGRGNLLLRGVPAGITPAEGERVIIDMLEMLMEQGKTGNDKIKHDLAALLACKSAVKAGERMPMEAMRSLIRQLSSAEEPYTCPHGRPTVVSFTERQLAAMFKRV